MTALQADLDCLLRETNQMLSSDLGIVDRNKFQQSLTRAAGGEAMPVVPLLRTLLIEAWLRHIFRWTGGCELSFLPSESLQSPLYTSDTIHSSLS